MTWLATLDRLPDVLESRALHERGQILGSRKAAHARRQVRVGLPARQHSTGERHEHVEPKPEERTKNPAGTGDLEDGHLPSGPQHPCELAQPSLEVFEVADAEAHSRTVEISVGERESERVTLNPLDRSRLATRALEHAR